MSGKRLSQKEMSNARFEMEVLNARIKRKEVDPKSFSRTAHVVCGCGAEGCMFVTRWPSDNNPYQKRVENSL